MPQQLATTSYGPMEYRLEGRGPTVMILQGGHCSRESRLSHEHLVDYGFSVLTPSRPGYDSTPARVGPTAQQAADALAALMDELHIPRADVIGISAAGPTALALAQRHPNRVRKLVLESAIATPWDAKTKQQARLLFGKAEQLTWGFLKLLLKLAPMTIMRVMVQAFTTLEATEVIRHMSPEDLNFVRRLIQTSRSGTGFIHDIDHHIETLAAITSPVLVMYSPHDKAAPPTNAQRVAAEIPTCELYEVPAETHLIWIGPSAEAVWQKRLEYLTT